MLPLLSLLAFLVPERYEFNANMNRTNWRSVLKFVFISLFQHFSLPGMYEFNELDNLKELRNSRNRIIFRY